MKNLLLLSGVGLTGFAFYYYFKKQVKLATDFDYKISQLRVVNIDSDSATINATMTVRNRSSFEVEILEYALAFDYDGKLFANTASNNSFKIPRDSSFDIQATGVIDFTGVLKSLLPFAQDIVKKKSIKIGVNGFIKINFLGFNHTVKIEGEKFTYSQNLLADIGVEQKFDSLTEKLGSLLKF